VRQARDLGTFGYKNKFEGFDIIRGMKVSCIINLFGDSDRNWLWGMLELMVGQLDKDKMRIFSPAVFFLNLHYLLQKDRSESAMRKVNGQFLENCIVCVKQRHGFFSPKRYKEIKMARELHERLEANSLDFWNGISPVSK
jgi:hypothetical protein